MAGDAFDIRIGLLVGEWKLTSTSSGSAAKNACFTASRSRAVLQELYGIGAGKNAAGRNYRDRQIVLPQQMLDFTHEGGQIEFRPRAGESQMPTGQRAFYNNMIRQPFSLRRAMQEEL